MTRSAAISLCLLSLWSSFPAVAQRPPRPDSTRRDSTSRDSLGFDSVRVRPIHDPRMFLVPVAGAAILFVGGAAIAFAPAPLALIPRRPDHSPMEFLEDHRSVYLTIGGMFGAGEGWAQSTNVEMLHGRVLTEVAFEDFHRERRVQHLTFRGGYLFHPRRGTGGGLTLGYRYAGRGWVQSGVEVGLPFLIGDSTRTGRIEPTYVLSQHGVLWSYRLQYERRLGGGPYFAGLRATGKSAPLNTGHPLYPFEPREYFAQAVALLFGTRF